MTFPCSICGGDGANQYRSEHENGESGQWFHLLCLLKRDVATESTQFRWTRQTARGYLAGLIDGEGHVRKDSGKTEIVNNDIFIIAAGKTAAESLGIPCQVRVTCSKDGYMPTFGLSLLGGLETRKKLLRLPIASPKKRKNLARTKPS